MPRAKVAPGRRVEALLLERLELARRELELLRDVGERESARFARSGELLAYCR